MQGDLFSQIQPKPRTKEYHRYTPEEIMASSVEYFHGDELAANVWMNKYALREDDKIYELNPDMMHHRLASEYARIEQKYPNPLPEADIYRLLKDFRFYNLRKMKKIVGSAGF